MKKKRMISILISTILITNFMINCASAVTNESNITQLIATNDAGTVAMKLVDESNKIITNGIGGDLTNQLDTVKGLSEGTAIIRFTAGTTLQSLFSVSNNTRAAEHFHVYVNGGTIGYELRKDTGNVSVGKASVAMNPGINTLAFKAEKNIGYSIFLNGKKVLSVTNTTAAFLTHLEGANKFELGRTDRSGSNNEYNMIGKVDYFKVYDIPLSDTYLSGITSETSELVLPDGLIKTDPISVYKPGELSSNNFRIPSMITTTSGSLIAGIDVRVGGGADSPNNINTGVKRSVDDGSTWDSGQVLLDYPDLASGIDTSLLQDKTTGEIFMLVDVFPSGKGAFSAARGTGFTTINYNGQDVRAMNLTHTSGSKYYAIPDSNGFSLVVDSNNNLSDYTVDNYNNLYKSGAKIGNTFAATSELKADGTSFLALISSKDDGITWSAPKIISGQFKKDWQSFLGTGPGRGIQVTTGEHVGRLIFPVYSLNRNQKQSSAVIYSDDHGITWNQGESVNDNRVVSGIIIQGETFTGASLEEMTEAQVVEMPNGELKMFMRNPSRSNPGIATSKDGGATWEDVIEYETSLKEPYCQLSVINYSQLIDGKPAVIFSNPDATSRAEGTVQVGLINNVGTAEAPIWDFDWKYKKLVKPGYYAYSCLTELSNGDIGLFYEGTANTEMSYIKMNLDYLKADLLAMASAAKILSVTSMDGLQSYNSGSKVNLKLTFDQPVSIIGDRTLTLIISGKEFICNIIPLSATEYQLTGVLPTDISHGTYQISIKAKIGLDIINVAGKLIDLSTDISLNSNLIINYNQIFSYSNMIIVNGSTNGDISSEVNKIKDLESGTIVMRFDNKGGTTFQSLLSFGNNTVDKERFYVYLTGNNKIGIERQSADGNRIVYAGNLSLNDGMNNIAVKIEKGVGYSIFLNGVKLTTTGGTTDTRFVKGITAVNSVYIGKSDRGSNTNEGLTTGDFDYVNLYSSLISDEELITMTTLNN